MSSINKEPNPLYCYLAPCLLTTLSRKGVTIVSGLDSGNSKDYSKYDGMSTESLEELLRLDAELPDGEGSDIDEILYI